MAKERDFISEKRFKLRNSSKKPGIGENNFLAGLVTILLIIILVFSAYPTLKQASLEEVTPTPPREPHQIPQQRQPVKEQSKIPSKLSLDLVPNQAEKESVATPQPTPKSKENSLIASIPAPKITILSPQNASSINETTPLLKMHITGQEIDTVWIKVDGRPSVVVGHKNGTISDIYLDPLFVDNFDVSTGWEGRSGTWILEDGAYVGYSRDSTYVKSAKKIGGTDFFIQSKIMPKEIYTKSDRQMRIGIIGQKNPSGDSSDWALVLTTEGNVKSLKLLEEFGDGWGSGIKFDWETNKEYYMKMQIDGNTIRGKVWHDGLSEPPWMITDTYNNKLTDGYIGLYSGHALTKFDDILVWRPLDEGLHKVEVYANNTAGGVGSSVLYFNVEPIREIYGIGSTIIKGSFAITLNRYSPIREIRNKGASTGLYAMVEITVENIGKVEKVLSFDSTTVLLDDLGNQYEFKKLTLTEEIKQVTLYPGAKARGYLYFTPAVFINAQNVKLILNLGGEKYEFEFKAF